MARPKANSDTPSAHDCIEDSQLSSLELDQPALVFGGIVSMIAELGDDAEVWCMTKLVGTRFDGRYPVGPSTGLMDTAPNFMPQTAGWSPLTRSLQLRSGIFDRMC
jgi:hypothetical protein